MRSNNGSPRNFENHNSSQSQKRSDRSARLSTTSIEKLNLTIEDPTTLGTSESTKPNNTGIVRQNGQQYGEKGMTMYLGRSNSPGSTYTRDLSPTSSVQRIGAPTWLNNEQGYRPSVKSPLSTELLGWQSQCDQQYEGRPSNGRQADPY